MKSPSFGGNDQLRLEVRRRAYPTRATAERSTMMDVEFAVNQSGNRGEPNLAEIVWTTGDIKRALADLPSIVPARIRREFQRLLQPWPAGRYVEAYRRSGGILNLFTPVWGENQDEVWLKMLAGWQATLFADERARRTALIELEQQWNTTPQPFFAGLTPAQIMIGGGPLEAKLADEFLTQLERTLAKQNFVGEGAALIKTLMLLRGWQVEPQRGGQTPWQIITTERNDLLRRRERALTNRSA
jgi:tRNA nucleotidyltransferase/poly(A) polymerase